MAKKSKPRKPDELFSMGPITLARFGKHVVFESDWPEKEFEERQKHLIATYPIVVGEIDTLVSKIKDLIRILPPEKLLQRASWERMMAHTKISAEDEIGQKEIISTRMIDYVQSVVASVPPAENQKDDVTDEEWGNLTSTIEQLFRKINIEYQICRTAKNRTNNPNLDKNLEEFQFKAQLYWCNVRGQRYQVHQPAYLEEMFLPHTDALQELFGISGKEFVTEINRIWHGLSFGVRDLFNDLELFRHETMDAAAKKLKNMPSDCEPTSPDLMNEVIEENAWEDRRDDIFGRFFGMDLFDLQKITALPEKLLAELSWQPGEETEFFAEGEFRGWPLRIWPVFKRPFIRLGDRYYCFDLHSLFDNLYRVMQRLILRLKPDYQEVWNSVQQDQSEDLPFKHLEHLLPGGKILKQVYYRGKTDNGTNDWCEADGILIYDDHLFIVEARGGAFTYTPPSSDFPAHIKSLKNLVLKPAMQGQRFLKYLESAESVPLFDSNHNKVDELRKSDFRCITICPVTLDPFTELVAQTQHLRKIGVDVGDTPVWTISLDDLRIYADIFGNPLIFLHYVEQRIQAFRSEIIQCDDELDHLGLYLKHNHYSTYAKELQGNSDAFVGFNGYRSEIDKFFHARMSDPETPCPLKQHTPARFLEIVELLSRSNKPGRAEVAAYMLDSAGDWRTKIDKSIFEELALQPTTRRPRPFSAHGNVKLTIFCWTEHSGPRRASLALDHAQTIVVMHSEARRLLMELTYASTGELQNLDWTWIELAGIPPDKLPNLQVQAEVLRKKRISASRTERQRIGRNDPCPCGSGKKYKKCCLGRWA